MESSFGLSKEQMRAIISQYPLFSSLKPDEIDELEKLIHVQKNFLNQVIVNKGDLVDSVYLIADGKAEVKSPEDSKQPIALLSTGDAIGLTDVGFFSKTGERTATVVARTNVILLCISLKDLHEFIGKYLSYSHMQDLSKQLLHAQFLKKVMPFTHLSNEKILWLTKQIKEIQVPANQIIFNEGDDAEDCYLIHSGKIEVFVLSPQGQENRIAVLEPPMIFGETAILVDEKRNASVRTLEDCSLLILKRQDLKQIVEEETESSKALMIVVGQRSRPKQQPHIKAYERKSADGKLLTVLKDLQAANYYQLSEEGKFIWDQLDGKKTLQDITLAFFEKYKVFSPASISSLILNLARSGFVHIPMTKLLPPEILSFREKIIQKIRGFMDMNYIFSNIDQWVTKSYHSIFHIFFKKISLLLIVLIAIIGIVCFVLFTGPATKLFTITAHPWWLIIALIPVNLVFSLLHELSHAYTMKYFNRQVLSFGVGLYWLTPIFFTDTSDMWLSEHKQRIAVNAAGTIFDLSIGGLAAIFAWAIDGQSTWAVFLWLLALSSYIGVFKNLSPIMEYDGYYIVRDVFDKPNLRESAMVWLLNTLPQTFRHPSQLKQYLPEMLYWLWCIIYFILTFYVALFVQQTLFPGLFPEKVSHLFNSQVAWLLPALTVLLSSLSLLSGIKNAIQEEKEKNQRVG